MSRKKKDTGAQSEKAERRAQAEAQRKKQQKLMMVTGIAVIAVIVVAVGISVLQNVGQESEIFTRDLDEEVDFRLDEQPRLGSDLAPVTIIEFADFQCPHCKTFHDEKLSKLERDYIGIGSVQFYFLNFAAMGTASQVAAEAVECVFQSNPSLFWDAHDAMFAAQERIVNSGRNDAPVDQVRETIESILREDLPTDPIISDAIACLRNGDGTAAVRADYETGLDASIRGTPSVFVNNTFVDSTNENLFFSYIDRLLR